MATETLTAARALPPTQRRRTATAVLVLGTVLSVAAAFGPIWVARGGMLIAVAAAAASSVLAWREVKAERHDHAAAMLAASRTHGEHLRIERTHNSAVLQAVTDRNVAATAEITRQQTVIAQLRGEISSLKGDRAALTAEITRRESLISGLRATVRERELELVAARTAVETAEAALALAAEAAAQAAVEAVRQESDGAERAEVHTMPRRVLLDGEEAPRRASQDAAMETVVDLDSSGLDRGPERRAEWHEPVLPNYEEDRRLA